MISTLILLNFLRETLCIHLCKIISTIKSKLEMTVGTPSNPGPSGRRFSRVYRQCIYGGCQHTPVLYCL